MTANVSWRLAVTSLSWRRELLSVSFSLILLASLLQGFAATVTWQGDVSTNWADGANWDTGTPPGVSDDVVIDGAYPYHPVLDLSGAGVSVNKLDLGASEPVLWFF